MIPADNKEESITAQELVDPSNIEPKLLSLWDALSKKNKIRASLFNLIVFSQNTSRTDYFRSIVQKVVERFPCRTLFISHDPKASTPYLKTAISVVLPQGADGAIACDQIDIGVGGPDLDRVFFLVLPHLTPDLPVYLLWGEDPAANSSLFKSLAGLSSRIIFDSESSDDLLAFAKTLLELRTKMGIDIADLNWARTEGWRDLIASLFDSPERLSKLNELSLVKITYNALPTEFFCHLKIQAMYLLSWLASRLNWKFEKAGRNFHLQFEKLDAKISEESWKKLGPGTVISASFQTDDGSLFEAKRIPEQHHHVKIQVSSSEKCELPFQFVLGKTATGQSLVTEICKKGTSSHYLDMLQRLIILDKDHLC